MMRKIISTWMQVLACHWYTNKDIGMSLSFHLFPFSTKRHWRYRMRSERWLIDIGLTSPYESQKPPLTQSNPSMTTPIEIVWWDNNAHESPIPTINYNGLNFLFLLPLRLMWWWTRVHQLCCFECTIWGWVQSIHNLF